MAGQDEEALGLLLGDATAAAADTDTDNDLPLLPVAASAGARGAYSLGDTREGQETETDAECAAVMMGAPAAPLESAAAASPPPTPTKPKKDKFPFQPHVQGLRAVAIVLVLLYHTDTPGFEGGFLGVPMFFVISGYLITGLLRVEAANNPNGRIGIVSFYSRRVRRLLPMSALTLLMAMALTHIVLPYGPAMELYESGKAASTYRANLFFASVGRGYQVGLNSFHPLLHFWSLAVEEQFYFAWPFALFLLGFVPARLQPRAALAVTAAAVISSLAVAASNRDKTDVFYMPYTRAWELLLGALAALAHRELGDHPAARRLRTDPRLATALQAGGLLIVVISVFTAGNSAGHAAGLWVVAPVLGTACAAWHTGSSFVELGLAWRPLQWIGDRSYGIYLLHWPLIVVTDFVLQGTDTDTATRVLFRWMATVAAVGMAALLYETFERPLHRSARLRAWPRATLVAAAALTVALFLAFSGAKASLRHSLDGVHGPAVPGLQVDGLATLRAALDPGALAAEVPANIVPAVGKRTGFNWYALYAAGPTCDVPPSTDKFAHECVHGSAGAGDGDERLRIFLVGDSKAGQWNPALVNIAARHNHTVYLWAAASCPFNRDPRHWVVCYTISDNAIAAIQRAQPHIVILSEFYGYTSADEPALSDAYRRMLEAIRPWGGQLVLISDVLDHTGAYPGDCLAQNPRRLRRCDITRDRAGPEHWFAMFERQKLFAASQPDVDFVNALDLLCGPCACPAVVGNLQPMGDEHHLDDSYVSAISEAVYDKLRPTIARVLA